MNTDLILELVGYFASLLVLISLLMTSVVKLRVINGIGALIFTVYAVLIRSYPTAVMNGALVFINIFFLVKVLRTQKLLSLTTCQPEDSAVTHFTQFYRQDISQCFPDYNFDLAAGQTCWMVYADANPVGLMVGTVTQPETVAVSLDYACPSHRDCSVGTYLYACLAQQGIRQLVAETTDPRHSQYLRKMGFGEKNGKFVKNL